MRGGLLQLATILHQDWGNQRYFLGPVSALRVLAESTNDCTNVEFAAFPQRSAGVRAGIPAFPDNLIRNLFKNR